MSRIATYILAGGHSLRFGSDKARAPLTSTETVLEAVVRRARHPILVVDALGRYRDLVPCPDIPDRAHDRGPAVAIATALLDARARGVRRARILSCDMPTFDPAWWSLLEATDTPAAAFADAERWQPLASSWDVERAARGLDVVDGGPAFQLLEAVGAQRVACPADWEDLVSINTPEALERARRIYERQLSHAHSRPVGVRRIHAPCPPIDTDRVAIEEPLELRLTYPRRGKIVQAPLTVTMRTPGDDVDLALGFLFSEGILKSLDDVRDIDHCDDGQNTNVLKVELAQAPPRIEHLRRSFTTTSSCGVCGKNSLDALRMNDHAPIATDRCIHAEILQTLPRTLRAAQPAFDRTGGIHAAGLADLEGRLLDVREDVGRHNALDKLIGASLRRNKMPWNDRLIILSGRASFELLQKALAARAPFVVAVGAPSSLALELAQRFGITLAGFARHDRLNVYTHPQRIRT